MTKVDESVFPVQVPPGHYSYGSGGGLTKREYFAGLAMQTLAVLCLMAKAKMHQH